MACQRVQRVRAGLLAPARQGSEVVGNAEARNGTRTYRCQAWDRRSHPDAGHERISLQAVERIFGMHRNTVPGWVKRSR